MFSKDEIDTGSKLLIDTIEIGVTDTVIDLGCGYGAIGLVAAYLANQGKVWMIDTDIRAVKYSKINANLNKISNVEIVASDGFEEVPKGIEFDIVVSHPPTHMPKETIVEFIEGAHARLKNKGKLYFVTERRVKPMIKREIEKVFKNYKALDSIGEYSLSFAEKATQNGGL